MHALGRLLHLHTLDLHSASPSPNSTPSPLPHPPTHAHTHTHNHRRCIHGCCSNTDLDAGAWCTHKPADTADGQYVSARCRLLCANHHLLTQPTPPRPRQLVRDAWCRGTRCCTAKLPTPTHTCLVQYEAPKRTRHTRTASLTHTAAVDRLGAGSTRGACTGTSTGIHVTAAHARHSRCATVPTPVSICHSHAAPTCQSTENKLDAEGAQAMLPALLQLSQLRDLNLSCTCHCARSPSPTHP